MKTENRSKRPAWFKDTNNNSHTAAVHADGPPEIVLTTINFGEEEDNGEMRNSKETVTELVENK